ncbi:condensation protein [Streptomyces sp. NPDC050703]|uniref:phthiocerol/phthiodiolone dimycocerosyl transferase family protein n=1 Tax=Streptomyces sp. NPDC050703 TaxID=3157218 RepID=UPI00344670EB
MERLLSGHEAMMTAGDMRVVTVWELRGDIDAQALQSALGRLVCRYPVLGGNLSLQGETAYVRVMAGRRPAVRLVRATDLRQELNAATDWSEGPLLRMALITRERTGPPGRTHLLVTTLPRACVDGTSIIALHQALWSLYADACSGRPAATAPVLPVLAPAIEEAFHHKYTPDELREYVARRAETDARVPPARLPSPASAGPGPGPDMTFGAARVSVDAAGTAALVDIAHGHALSVNSLVCGLFTAAVRPALDPADGPVSVCCGVAVDMRRRVTPPIPEEVLQSAASGMPVRLSVDVPADPLALGRDLAASVREGLAAGIPERELAAFPYMARQCPPTFFVTNLGRIAVPSLPGGLVATGLRVLPMARIPTLFVVVTRFGDGLHIDLPVSRSWYTDAQIDDLAARTHQVVDEVIAAHAAPAAGSGRHVPEAAGRRQGGTP